ncbi:hypothetical protein P8C59_009413 [Phyllachora maydis]|uniref:Uncharacterized protein n=1 Tax=Phyllachora maydis TaxID=1825666 RepID=A0AAD9MJQ1_9PEZI|nr:hypothetical protein P8C59_009413 [Phyllachora maydis]
MALHLNTTTARTKRDSSLLSPSEYDNDAASIRSDQESDSDDDERQMRARNSRELLAHDRLVLMEEDEMDHLITELMTEAQHGEDGELMYEMEEGGMREGSSTGDSSEREDSVEVDRQGLLHLNETSKQRSRAWRRWLLLHAIISVAFAILVLVAWKLSRGHRVLESAQMVTNGTAWFAPTTIILSLDGFRADFLQRGLTPRLNGLIREGVSPPYMTPSFPSVTFPNHYTLATGLYPESHGIVGNEFWDPALGEEFSYADPSRSMNAKWWDGEPFWVTAEKSGLKTAIHMWPGSEAHILGVEPSYVDRYSAKEPLPQKVDRIFEFLDMSSEARPQIIAAYVPNVDSDGHKYGPNSTEIMSTIRNVDGMVDSILKGLEQRNLTNIVNVIVVSDHGMATTDVSRLIQLEDLVDADKIEHTDGWPLVGLRPKKPDELQEIHAGLVEKAKSYPGSIDVYLRDVDMPARYHFSKNARIAPLWIIPKAGWGVVRMDEMDLNKAKASGAVYHPRGLHGYDHEHPLMRAIFIARGPAFPRQPNSRLEVFQNIEVYNILCDSVGLAPRPNNGTLRLPLKPFGLHDEGAAETPPDPDPDPDPSASSSAHPASPSVNPVGVDQPSSDSGPGTALHDGEDQGDKSTLDEIETSAQDFWDWFTGKVKDWWDKAKESVSKVGSS